ncbi:MAG: hypothetical protein J2P37_12455 [Ktedonobacteraceae bacterium]|nr:hypothetical protein [Ktedonobacteraceae bacterium]
MSDNDTNSTTSKQQQLTDLNNAKGFLSVHGSHLKFVPGWGWLLWDGRRWLPNATDQVLSLARHTIATHYHDEAAALPTNQRARAQQLVEHAQRSTSLTHIQAMLDLASQDESVRALPTDFDRHPLLLNVENGTVDLLTGKLSPHDPAHLLTRCCPIAYDPEARSPQWTSFIEACLENDPEYRRYLQVAAGYSLTGSTQQDAFFLLHGTGHNGKTTFLEALAYALGDYVLRLPVTALLHSRALTDLRMNASTFTGRRLLLLTETTEDQLLNLSTLKRLASGEPLFLLPNRPGDPPQPWNPTCKLWLATNHLPRITEQTPAIWRRLKLLPFTVSFENRENRTLSEQFQKDAQAILAWLVQGCLLWRQYGMPEPPRVIQAITTYRDSQDRLADYLTDRFDLGEDFTTPAREIYRDYYTWATDAHIPPLSEHQFFRQLAARGFKRERTRTCNVYRGLALKPKSKATPRTNGAQHAHDYPGITTHSSHESSLPLESMEPFFRPPSPYQYPGDTSRY